MKKTILCFDFDGLVKTIWLEEAKQANLLVLLHGWIRSSKSGLSGIPFKEFETVMAKIRHAFTAIPAGGDSLPHATDYFNQNHRRSTSSTILFYGLQ
jgi:hypothetical protein